MRSRMPGEAHRAERKPVSIDAVIRFGTGRKLSVKIIDTSYGGCKVRSLHILPIGEIVQIEIPAFLPNLASVRWSLPGRAGLRFLPLKAG